MLEVRRRTWQVDSDEFRGRMGGSLELESEVDRPYELTGVNGSRTRLTRKSSLRSIPTSLKLTKPEFLGKRLLNQLKLFG